MKCPLFLAMLNVRIIYTKSLPSVTDHFSFNIRNCPHHQNKQSSLASTRSFVLQTQSPFCLCRLQIGKLEYPKGAIFRLKWLRSRHPQLENGSIGVHIQQVPISLDYLSAEEMAGLFPLFDSYHRQGIPLRRYNTNLTHFNPYTYR